MKLSKTNRLALLVLGVSSVLLAGPASAEDVRTVEVKAKEFAFAPAQIAADAGERLRIKLVNNGSLSHNLHIKGDGKTETIQGNKSASVTFTVPDDGPVAFFCNVPGHKQAGMTGQVIVD